MTEECPKNIIQRIDHYPLLLDATSIIISNVLDGIKNGKPIHMSVGDYSLIDGGGKERTLPLNEIKIKLSHYEIVASESAISGSFIRLKHTADKDVFEEGEFIYTCSTGSFHLKFDSYGTFAEMISDFNGDTPEFISQLVNDFPGNNFVPDEELLEEISNTDIVENHVFLSGLQPFTPISIEVD